MMFKQTILQVQITFPDQGKKSDVVTLRGPKVDVDKCYQHLHKLTQDMVRSQLVLKHNFCLASKAYYDFKKILW